MLLLGGPACKRSAKNSTQKEKSIPAARAVVPGGLSTFTPEEFAIVSAACDRILPRDQDVGAIDANVPVYIDRMLQTAELADMRDVFLAATALLNVRSKRLFDKGFADAAPEQQDRLLTYFKNSPKGTGEARYYEQLIALTLEGFLGDPSYGGNKKRVGWALVGFETSEPPVGYDGKKHLHAHGGQ